MIAMKVRTIFRKRMNMITGNLHSRLQHEATALIHMCTKLTTSIECI
eukprot:COSAG02_NODE_857_length_16462_cov_4.801381_3_plen_47_part_00